ncbi:transposase domain-containing protein [Catenibacterium mitsuokai]|uniref:transposase domain-containing protein n=1 Tax=Catenibacterium mitsuokai TaxID=100886 RepID=UPI0039AFF17D
MNECNIRPFTVSRNWLFSTSTKGADASASIFSLIETAKANRLSPFDYVEYILEIMPQIDNIQHPEKIDWFMSWSDQIKEEFRIKDD